MPNRYTGPLPLAQRFWSKVDKSGDCWIWTASYGSVGYGQFGIAGKLHGAHRVAYELVHGPIPEGLRVLHRCDNRACVRPDHLFLGTQADNMADMHSKGRGYSYFRQYPERVLRGEQQHAAKLTDDVVRKIRRLHADGLNYPELAARFGVCKQSICNIVRRHTWRHVA